MAIIDDYAAIAAEMRRIQVERALQAKTDKEPERILPRHPMRATPAGDLLFRRLVARRRP